MSSGLLIPQPSGELLAVRGGPVQACGCARREVRTFAGDAEAIAWISQGQHHLSVTEEERRMGIIVGVTRFEAAPEGLHPAACCDVIDLGEVDTTWGRKRQIDVVFQIEATDKNGRRFTPRKRYTASLDRRSNLRKDLESWRGRKFTPAEEEKFDLENLLGKPCQIQIVHNPGDNGNVYANIANIVPAGKGTELLTVAGYTRKKDREAGSATPPEEQQAELEPVPF